MLTVETGVPRNKSNHQPISKAMKAPHACYFVALLLPSALLLSQCAPSAGTAPQTVTAIAASKRHRVRVSIRPEISYQFSGLLREAWSARSEKEPPRIAAGARAVGTAGELQPVLLAPLVVTDNLNYARVAGMRYWPSDVVDAEQKKTWISLPQKDHPRPYPRDDADQTNTLQSR
jgi:hypothetical protein